MQGKRIIIIGGGLLQVPAIQIAKEMGLFTIVFDYNKDVYGMKIADLACVVSTRDVDGSVRVARELANKMDIHGVITVGTDASTTVAAVANALSLPGNKFEDAYAASNKIRMRERFKSHNVPQPNFFPVWTVDEAYEAFKNLNKPVVIKPADNMGARGVMKVSNIDEVLMAFNRAKSSSPSGEVIIEEFMDGDELSIDMLIYNNEIFVTGIADRIIEFPPYFIETGHILPSQLPKEQIDDAIDVMKKGIKALNLKIGAAKGDIKVTKNGAMVGEIAARLSGGFMSAYTYPLATGVNLIKNAIEIALGNPPSDLKPKWSKVAIEKAFLPGTGVIEGISGVEEAKNINGVKEIFIKVKEDDILVAPTNNLEKAGNIIVVGNTLDDALNIVNKAMNLVHFKLTNEKNLNIEEIKKQAIEKLSVKIDKVEIEEYLNRNINVFDNYSFSPSIIHQEKEYKTNISIFNNHLSQPIIIDTIHNLPQLIDGIMDIKEYYEINMDCASNTEVLCILNDFNNDEIFDIAINTIKNYKRGIMMINGNKSKEVLLQKVIEAEKNNACAVGIDLTYYYSSIDNNNEKMYIKTEKEINKIRKSIDIPIIIKGLSNKNDIIKNNITNVYFTNNNKYQLKNMKNISDIIVDTLLSSKNNNKINIIAESNCFGTDIFKYLVLGANLVSITDESFIATIGKGIKGLEYLIFSNKEKLDKMTNLFRLENFKYDNKK